MLKNDDLWNELNTLLAFLREFEVDRIVAKHYASNDAPARILNKLIAKLQNRLDVAPEKEVPC